MSEALRDQNRVTSLITVSSVDGATVKPATYTPITGVNPVNVALVDGSGSQIVSFGGDTQYTDGGTPPANPVGPTLLWSDGTDWQTVSTAKPLPVTASIDTTGLATSTGQTTGNNLLGDIAGLLPDAYDNITQTQDSTHDVWVFKLVATTKATITITYTDNTKAVISTVVKT